MLRFFFFHSVSLSNATLKLLISRYFEKKSLKDINCKRSFFAILSHKKWNVCLHIHVLALFSDNFNVYEITKLKTVAA